MWIRNSVLFVFSMISLTAFADEQIQWKCIPTSGPAPTPIYELDVRYDPQGPILRVIYSLPGGREATFDFQSLNSFFTNTSMRLFQRDFSFNFLIDDTPQAFSGMISPARILKGVIPANTQEGGAEVPLTGLELACRYTGPKVPATLN